MILLLLLIERQKQEHDFLLPSISIFVGLLVSGKLRQTRYLIALSPRL